MASGPSKGGKADKVIDWSSDAMVARLEPIARALRGRPSLADEAYAEPAQLAQLAEQLQEFVGAHLGRGGGGGAHGQFAERPDALKAAAAAARAAGPVPVRPPARLFRDFSPTGSLATILGAVLEFRREMRWRSLDFAAPARHSDHVEVA